MCLMHEGERIDLDENGAPWAWKVCAVRRGLLQSLFAPVDRGRIPESPYDQGDILTYTPGTVVNGGRFGVYAYEDFADAIVVAADNSRPDQQCAVIRVQPLSWWVRGTDHLGRKALRTAQVRVADVCKYYVAREPIQNA